MITLSSKDSSNAASDFKGFFVQARSTTSGDANPVGEAKHVFNIFVKKCEEVGKE